MRASRSNSHSIGHVDREHREWGNCLIHCNYETSPSLKCTESCPCAAPSAAARSSAEARSREAASKCSFGWASVLVAKTLPLEFCVSAWTQLRAALRMLSSSELVIRTTCETYQEQVVTEKMNRSPAHGRSYPLGATLITRRRKLLNLLPERNQHRSAVFRSGGRRSSFACHPHRSFSEPHVPLLARVRARGASGSDLWIPGLRAVRASSGS